MFSILGGFLKGNWLPLILVGALAFLWYDYIDSKKAVATLEQRQADLVDKIEEQNKGIAALKTDIYLRDQVDQIHTEKQEFLGGQLDAANKLLGKIQSTSWGTSAYPDDVYNALRMLEQGRP